MKKIITIICITVLFLICSCSKKQYTITLNSNAELNEFITYDNEYKIYKNEQFDFPQIDKEVYVFEEYEKQNSNVIYTKHIQYLDFIGWEDENNIIIKDNSIKINNNKTLTPVFNITSQDYTIILATKGLDISFNETSSSNNITLPIINNENYVFDGWYYNDLYIGKPIEMLQFNQVTNNLILFAKLTPTLEYVNSLINNLPNKLTIFDIDNIELAYESYKDLNYQDKQHVENYNKLQNAYSQIENLNIAYDLYCQLAEIYETDIAANLKQELDFLNDILNSLEPQIKELIPNLDYQKLKDITDAVNNLYELYIEDAKSIDKRIVQIPIFMEQYYEEEIITLYNEYQNLDPNLKVLLNAEDKLQTLYQNLQNLNNKSTIYYLNTPKTKNIYISKQQLFKAFFTDFYYYIAAYHGLTHLKNNKIKNVNDFVTLAGDFTGAGANNLYGIGNIAGRYMLEKDINGILENQTDNGFFGFCYQNNLYQDVLPFFINFFAYWRIDEKYANTSNYGADIFAESWAPTVDIAKFFYYDEETSYVKTERMIDCLTNTASVVYNFDEKDLLTTLKLRGYSFDGWYDNENYSGNKITDISQVSSKKLYAKWSIDENQVDKDAANLVDIYIYNLTTTKAIVNSTTVGYVKTMYDNLSRKGKSLVKNYSTLEKLLTKYN